MPWKIWSNICFKVIMHCVAKWEYNNVNDAFHIYNFIHLFEVADIFLFQLLYYIQFYPQNFGNFRVICLHQYSWRYQGSFEYELNTAMMSFRFCFIWELCHVLCILNSVLFCIWMFQNWCKIALWMKCIQHSCRILE